MPSAATSDCGRGLRVAYVVSMATGLHSFVYREIRELRENGVGVILLPTKIGAGPYPPSADWPVERLTALRALASHWRMLVRDNRRYVTALLEAIRMRALIDFAFAGFFSDAIIMQNVQLIHCHFGDHKLFIGYFCGKLTNRPVSVTIHAYELYTNPNPAMFRRALASASAIVTIAEFNRSVLEHAWGAARDKIAVIPLFADIPPPPERRRKRRERIVILTVARLVPKKGLQTLLEAISLLPLNYEAWIVGTGQLDIVGLVKRLDLEDRVRLYGGVSDAELAAIYELADIFCLPSETVADGDREGIPVVLMEAMAHALPVVATRHAGIPELVSEILVSERDPRQLADALLALGADRDLREAHGRQNYEIVLDRFSHKNVLLLISVFERLAS